MIGKMAGLALSMHSEGVQGLLGKVEFLEQRRTGHWRSGKSIIIFRFYLKPGVSIQPCHIH